LQAQSISKLGPLGSLSSLRSVEIVQPLVPLRPLVLRGGLRLRRRLPRAVAVLAAVELPSSQSS
jgi:hypothetical protein